MSHCLHPIFHLQTSSKYGHDLNLNRARPKSGFDVIFSRLGALFTKHSVRGGVPGRDPAPGVGPGQRSGRGCPARARQVLK